MCFMEASLVSQLFLVPKEFCTIKRSWKPEEICAAILLGTTMVMTLYAPDSKKSGNVRGLRLQCC